MIIATPASLGANRNRDVTRRKLAVLDSETGQTTFLDLTQQAEQPQGDPAGADR